jgi:hypothetical protein
MSCELPPGEHSQVARLAWKINTVVFWVACAIAAYAKFHGGHAPMTLMVVLGIILIVTFLIYAFF